MNKKGDFEIAGKTLFWMISSILIAMVVLFFVFGISSYKNNLTKVPSQLRAELLVLRFVNIPECFARVNSVNGVVSPGVIDLEKFTEKQLKNCYFTDSEKGFRDFNFRLHLEGFEKEITTNNYFHQDDFTLLKEVLVKTETGVVKDRLVIYVQEGVRP